MGLQDGYLLAMSRYEFPPMLGPAENFPVGSIEWAQRISNRLQIAADTVSTTTIHHLTRTIAQIWSADRRPWEVWPENRPFGTPDDYCKAVTGHPWKSLIEIVKEMGGEQLQFDFRDMQAELAKAQAKHRKPGRPSSEIRDHITVLRGKDDNQGGGTQSSYLLRRLARDHPVILEQYRRGDFKSARAAALAAGIVKPPKPRLKICPHCGGEL